MQNVVILITSIFNKNHNHYCHKNDFRKIFVQIIYKY